MVINNAKEKEVIDERLKELFLLYLYLAGWEEELQKKPGEKIFRSWKYRFDVLNSLENDQLIHQVPNGKSVVFLNAGIEKAKELKKKYLGE